MARLLYNLLLHLALPLMLARLWWRGRQEKGYRDEWAQRFGRYAASPQAHPSANSPAQPLIWLHAVSLGETRAAQPLVEALRARYPDHRLLITHMTATGRDAARSLYGDDGSGSDSSSSQVEFVWLPYDFTWAVARFYAHFQPALGILMETEVWPNLARAARARRMPLVLANARLSEKSLSGYQRIGALAREAFSGLIVAAQTDADAARLTALGARNVAITGNLKFDLSSGAVAAPLPSALPQWFGAGRVFLAASTREGEEELLLDALARAPFEADGNAPTPLVTVIVPRHPQRFDAVAALLKQRGIAFTRRSENRPLPDGCNVVLGDSLGEMQAYYTACDCAFIGGSLVPTGGQNLIEACAQGTPVLIGTHTFNFADAAEQAVAAGAAVRVISADDLLQQVRTLMSDAEKRTRMGTAGRAFCERHRGATARTMSIIQAALLSAA